MFTHAKCTWIGVVCYVSLVPKAQHLSTYMNLAIILMRTYHSFFLIPNISEYIRNETEESL